MLNRALQEYNRKELVYVPFGADKGDCPYCLKGVLRRDEETEDTFGCKEAYICCDCGGVFLEVIPRYFSCLARKRRF